MYGKNISAQIWLAIKKNWSNDSKLGNFQMWLTTPGQSLRSFDLLHILDSFNTFQNTIPGIINTHNVVRISYFYIWILLYGMNPRICFTSGTHFKECRCIYFEKGDVIFHRLFVNKKTVFADLWNTVSHAFFYICSRQPEMESSH